MQNHAHRYKRIFYNRLIFSPGQKHQWLIFIKLSLRSKQFLSPWERIGEGKQLLNQNQVIYIILLPSP